MSTYTLIPTPPGDWKNNLYDLHAIRMAALHNILIRSFNSIIYHAPNITAKDVPSFIKYCKSVVAMIHEHHQTEEELLFPFLEEKMGKNSMESNLVQHQDFMPKFGQWVELCKKVETKQTQFEATEFVRHLRESTDLLVVHLVDEIPTMESSRLKQHFTEAELSEFEKKLSQKIRELVSLWDLPLMLVNSDSSHNSWFPDDIPAPILFFARHVLMSISGSMWKYGQSNKYMQLKDEYKSMYAL